MIVEDFLSILFRIGELVFSATVISLTGSYIHTQENEAWNNNRFIFAEVVAVLGVLFSLLFLLPTMRRFIHFPVDFLLFVLFMTSYGLAVNYIGPLDCGSIWDWRCLTGETTCQMLKTDITFCFLAAVFFLASAILELCLSWHRRRSLGTPDSYGNYPATTPWFHR